MHEHPQASEFTEPSDSPDRFAAQEVDDPELVTYRSLFSPERLNALASYWVAEYGGEGLELTYEQEQALATQVQAGLATQKATEVGNPDISADDAETIRLGQRAELTLFEVNLRFAFMYARESVGIKHPGARRRFMNAQRGQQEAHEQGLESGNDAPRRRKSSPKRFFGNYRPLSSLKSPYASLEDRYTMAAIGLLDAVRKFKPGHSRKATFSTYAAWRIQSHLDRGVRETEGNGITLAHSANDEKMSYFAEYPSVDAAHIVPEKIDRLLRLIAPAEYPEDFDAESEGSLAELHDPWHEDNVPHGLAEIWGDPDDSTEFEAAHNFATNALSRALETLPEREEKVLRMRFGFTICDCHPEPTQHTLDEIGRVVGYTRERIRQIEAKSLSKLRHPVRTRQTRDALYWMEEADSLPAGTIWRGDSIKLPGDGAHLPDPEYPQDLSGALPRWSDRQWAIISERVEWEKRMRAREPWQAYPDEPWDMPLRELTRPAHGTEVRAVSTMLDQIPPYIFTKGFVRLTAAPYPIEALAQVKERLRKAQLTAPQITRLWDEFMERTYPRLEDELEDDFNPDRVGQLFSQLITENINDNDEAVHLKIPYSASYRIGYLACRLGLGKVEIYGDTGDHAGSWNRGYSSVRVNGNVRDYAGSMMTGSATLYVTGRARYALGVGAEGEAEISVNHAASIGTFREQARVTERRPRKKP